MKQWVGAIAIMIATATFAQDRFELLLSDIEDGRWEVDETVSTEELQKILSTTNDAKAIAEKMKMATLVHRMSSQYAAMKHMQDRLAKAQADVNEETLTAEEWAELSDAAKQYYARGMLEVTNRLASIFREQDEMRRKWSVDEAAGFEYWKQGRAAKQALRQLQEQKRREEEKRNDVAREEIAKVRSRHRRMKCEIDGDCIRWGGCGTVCISNPDECNRRIKNSAERLTALRANLIGLERMTPERLGKLSPLAQKKYREKLARCRDDVENEAYKKEQYESFWVKKGWPTMAEWKNQHDAEEMENRRKRAEDELAELELRLALIQAAKASGGVYEEPEPRSCWGF